MRTLNIGESWGNLWIKLLDIIGESVGKPSPPQDEDVWLERGREREREGEAARLHLYAEGAL